jgi:hypothetical protein
MGVEKSIRTSAGIGPTGVQHNGANYLRRQHLLTPQHRSGFNTVASEDSSRRKPWPVVNHQRNIGRT